MTISEIKSQLQMSVLPLNWFIAEDGTQTDWLRHWNNDKRQAVLMHKDVDTLLQNNPQFSNLGLKTEVKEGEQGEFTNLIIVAYKPADREY